jgi:hypothetical protein
MRDEHEREVLGAVLRELYVKRGLSIPKMMRALHMSQGRVYQLLKEYSIPVRGEGGSKPKRIHLTQELLDEIASDGISTVAGRLGVYRSALTSRLERGMAVGHIVVKDGRAVLLMRTTTATGLDLLGIAQQQGVTTPVVRPTTTWPSTIAQPVAAPEPQEPEPELFVRGRRVTDADVREMLRRLGDEELASYDRGTMSKREAFERAKEWMDRRLRAGTVSW